MSRARNVEAQLAELRKLDPEGLRDLYQRHYGRAAPARVTPETLVAVIGFKLQKQLIAQLRFRMEQVMTAGEAIVSALAVSSSEAILIRQWRGKCHLVTLLDDEVVYQGQSYRNLAAVARVITRGRASAETLFYLDRGPKTSNRGAGHGQAR